jgi:hypothetical protein
MKTKLFASFVLGAISALAILQWWGTSVDESPSGLVIRYQVKPTHYLANLDNNGKLIIPGVSIFSNGAVIATKANGETTQKELSVFEVNELLGKLNDLKIFQIHGADLEPQVSLGRPDYYWKRWRTGQSHTKIEVTIPSQRSSIEIYDLQNKMKEYPAVIAYKQFDNAIKEIMAATEYDE